MREDFNFEEFKGLYNMGDLLGLEYLGQFIENENAKEFYAIVMKLNYVNDFYENNWVEDLYFDSDIYFENKLRLFKMLDINIEEL